MHDAVVTGFIQEQHNSTYKGTKKAQIFYNILYPLGEITGTLDTYKKLKNKIDSQGGIKK